MKGLSEQILEGIENSLLRGFEGLHAKATSGSFEIPVSKAGDKNPVPNDNALPVAPSAEFARMTQAPKPFGGMERKKPPVSKKSGDIVLNKDQEEALSSKLILLLEDSTK